MLRMTIFKTSVKLSVDIEFIENKLFKPFQSTKEKGLGIGLYQCKMIIEAHDGQIRVKSKEGEGAEFRVTLPLGPVAEVENE